MPSSQIHYADLESGERLPLVSPASLILSSAGAGWRGIIVEQLRLPPMEPPENFVSDHLLTIRLGAPGDLEWRAGKRYERRTIPPGDVCFVPAGMPRDMRWREQSEVLALALDPVLVAGAAEEAVVAGRIELFERHGGADRQILHIGLALKAELESGSLGGPLYAESLATALAAHLLRRYSAFPYSIPDKPAALSPSKLRQVVGYIDENLHRTLTLAEMAAVAQISPYYFSRQFKQATGDSPYNYVLNRRIERAKPLLRAGRLTVGEIAHQLGFSDQSHFTRHFKRRVGQTPSAYFQDSAWRRPSRP